MEKKKALNLYACLGGNRLQWEDVEVTAVENDPELARMYQERFPNDIVIVGDAHQFLLENYKNFDFIWSSPPCPTHSKSRFWAYGKTKPVFPDMTLYEEIIFLMHHALPKQKLVVENVDGYYETLISANKIGRHLFWSNFEISAEEVKQPKGFITKSNLQGKKEMMDWLGIYFEENIYYENNHCPVQILRNCVHPKLGHAVFQNGR